MRSRSHLKLAVSLGIALLAMLVLGCSGVVPEAPEGAPTTSVSGTASPVGAGAADSLGAVVPSAIPTPTETPRPVVEVRASRLRIPRLGIDAPVQASQVVPDTSGPTPGCPPPEPGGETLTVPEQGIATPEAPIEGLENKVWVFGHSRWLGVPGLFFSLQDLGPGDEVVVDGFDRASGAAVTGLRFVVGNLYLTDTVSGTQLVLPEGGSPPPRPVVYLQTSVREDGPGKAWILDRAKVMAKARTLIEGDLNDPCKYLLLFVEGVAA